MDTKVLENIDSRFTSMDERIDALMAESSPEVKSGDILTNEEAEAEMAESGLLSSITSIKVWEIPVGEAIVGGAAAVFATELIDGVLYKQPPIARGVVKGLAAGATWKYGKKHLGKAGAGAIAMLLTFDAVRDIMPIDELAKQGANKITGIVTTKGLGGNSFPDVPAGFPMNEMQSLRQVQTDYYAGLRG